MNILNAPRSFLILLLFAQCQSEKIFETSQLYGFWQSLNNRNQVLAFKSDGSFKNYVNETDLYSELDEWNTLHYKVYQVIDAKRIELLFFDHITKKEYMRAEVHRVDDNRIRVLFLKHHHILDIADEFYKTDGFGNFEQIMESFY